MITKLIKSGLIFLLIYLFIQPLFAYNSPKLPMAQREVVIPMNQPDVAAIAGTSGYCLECVKGVTNGPTEEMTVWVDNYVQEVVGKSNKKDRFGTIDGGR